jgi:hypothetical protein
MENVYKIGLYKEATPAAGYQAARTCTVLRARCTHSPPAQRPAPLRCAATLQGVGLRLCAPPRSGRPLAPIQNGIIFESTALPRARRP